MTGRAAHAVSCKRAILEVRIGHLRLINKLAVEVRRRPVIEIELPLAHDAVAAKAGVHYFARELLAFGLVLVGLEVSQLAIELGIKDWVAPGQTHRRPAPFAVGR